MRAASRLFTAESVTEGHPDKLYDRISDAIGYDSSAKGFDGHTCSETPELIPLPIALAHRLSRRLARGRQSGAIPYLRPDGKNQVTVEYAGDRPIRLDTVVVSTQHVEGIDLDTMLGVDVRDQIVEPEINALGLGAGSSRLLVNPTGRFVLGGPLADAGLTGRKIIVDTYGGMARHGGGAFSGKDPSKIDRSAAYAMRWVAKNTDRVTALRDVLGV